MDGRTGRLVAGHGRLAALAAMHGDGQAPPDGVELRDDGVWLVPVMCGWSSRSDAEAAAYLVSNNRQTELARWDRDGLADVLTQVQEADPALLDAAGYSAGDLEKWLGLDGPPDLDKFAAEVGEGDADDGWPTVQIRATPTVSAAWAAYLDTHMGDAVYALAALLGVDAEQPIPAEWAEPGEEVSSDG